MVPKEGSSTLWPGQQTVGCQDAGAEGGKGLGEVLPFSLRPSRLLHLPFWLSICGENPVVHLFQRLNLQSSAGTGRRLGRDLTVSI